MRYLKYRIEHMGPYYVNLPAKLVIAVYAEMKDKGRECEIMPEGFIPTKEQLKGIEE